MRYFFVLLSVAALGACSYLRSGPDSPKPAAQSVEHRPESNGSEDSHCYSDCMSDQASEQLCRQRCTY
jgi:hypothetical protein